MAEHEQGGERWESVPGIGRNPPSYTKKGKRWLSNGAGVVMELNRLEADLAALRQQLADAEAKAALADVIRGRGQAVWLSDFLDEFDRRYDALASPSRDTGSEEGKG